MKKLLLTVLCASVCVLSVPAQAQNVAIVNGKPVPKTRMELLQRQVVARSGLPVTPELETQLRDEVIAREVFMQEARKLGLDQSEDYKAQVELTGQAVLINELFADFRKKNPVTDVEIKAEYDKLLAANSGKEYRARHILVEKEDEAKSILAQLKKGAKFDALAKKHSKDAGSAANGGDLDWANANSYVKEFSQALVKMGKGQVSTEPVKTEFGYHIIRLEDVRDAQFPSFEQVKPQIAAELQKRKLQDYQKSLRDQAKVE